MATYTGSDKRLAYLFEHGGGGGGSANIWTGTMAEYIAQASQIADDTAVFITDDEIQSLIVSSYDIYSEDEKEVGVFLDGKPLYQRTIDCGYAPDNTTKQIQHGIANIDKIVNVKGMGWSSANNTYYPIPFVQRSNVNYQIQMTAGRTAIDIATGSNLFTAVNIYATIQYTKTTDTAGSGLFVPSGAAAHHYSETEHVIGTWLNGETLYEKTIKGTTVTGGTTYNVAHNIANLKEIADVKITCNFTSNNYWRTLNFAYNNGSVNNNWLAGYAINSTYLMFQVGSAFSDDLAKWYATIQYTKTT